MQVAPVRTRPGGPGSLRNATTLSRVSLCVRAIKWSPGSHPPPPVSGFGPLELRCAPLCRGVAHGSSGLRSVAPRRRKEEIRISTEARINDRIRVPEVRLVGPNGEQVGIVRIEDALRLAQEAELDLVEVAAAARPPVCKLMDYGKFKYESAQKARESRRNQQLTVIKEQKLRPKIDTHDYETKRGHALRFLGAGDKVNKEELTPIAKSGIFLTDDPRGYKKGFDELAKKVAGKTEGRYIFSYCSTKRRGDHKLEVEVVAPKDKGKVSYKFSADGFKAGCTPKKLPSFAAGGASEDAKAAPAESGGAAEEERPAERRKRPPSDQAADDEES